jgi:hypothetical protein
MPPRLRRLPRAMVVMLVEQATVLCMQTRHGVATLVFTLTTVLVPAASAKAQCPTPDSLIEVNGRPMRTEGAANLMDILNRVASARRLGIHAVRPGDQPLVIIDGVQHNGGVRWLDDVALNEVQRLTTLRPVDAVARYGGVAVLGAIIVETRLGRGTSGQPRLPNCAVKRDP